MGDLPIGGTDEEGVQGPGQDLVDPGQGLPGSPAKGGGILVSDGLHGSHSTV
jgi:hypothetical protein